MPMTAETIRTGGNGNGSAGRDELRKLRAVADRQRQEAEVVQKDAFLRRVTHRS
ncbi:MAG TPA: hypothetical protein VIB48_16415 [Acidimicrobiia bacterium]|jgi:hypothetical protein